MMRPLRRAPDDPRQTRVFLRKDLLAAGHDDRSIARMVATGRWVRVRHGAYVDAAPWSQLDDAGRHGLRARAVVQQSRTKVVVSHVSGLVEYGAPTWGLDLDLVHVTRTDRRAGRREAGVRQHRGRVSAHDYAELNGLDVMTATRVALEVTTVAGVEASLVAVNHLLHHDYTSAEALAAMAPAFAHWPHSLTTDLVLRLADGRIESVGGTRAFHLCFREGLPLPTPQVEILDANGRVLARVDFAWPQHGVFLEFDGRIKYERLLKEGERPSDVVIREKQREELICRLTGWRCIRLTWADLEHPQRTAARIRTELATARAA